MKQEIEQWKLPGAPLQPPATEPARKTAGIGAGGAILCIPGIMTWRLIEHLAIKPPTRYVAIFRPSEEAIVIRSPVLRR
ncbi:hypothetical protein L1887_25422 [Cichorium endivia]|nr:hypothetical protein L1887_25422 [Cichorium endivia]